MIWKGKNLKTIGDLMEFGIDKCATKEEALQFMRLYRHENKHANENIGYLSGYYDTQRRKQIQDWFEVTHPILGNGDVHEKFAMAQGKNMGQRMKDKNEIEK
jgi:hypothetical protein